MSLHGALFSSVCMKTKLSLRYTLHPLLALCYEEWSRHGGCAGLSSVVADRLQTLAEVSVVHYRDLAECVNGQTVNSVQIIGPVLSLFSWRSPTMPPDGLHLVRLVLDDDEVCRLVIAEWLRLMQLSGDIQLIERVRQLFKAVFNAEQCARWFGVSHISQTYWAESFGLSLAQLARAAEACRKTSGALAVDPTSCSQVREPNFFSR